jgi:hypothetical protein
MHSAVETRRGYYHNPVGKCKVWGGLLAGWLLGKMVDRDLRTIARKRWPWGLIEVGGEKVESGNLGRFRGSRSWPLGQGEEKFQQSRLGVERASLEVGDMLVKVNLWFFTQGKESVRQIWRTRAWGTDWEGCKLGFINYILMKEKTLCSILGTKSGGNFLE